MSNLPNILVVGSVNIDLTMSVDRLPLPGETVAGTGFVSNPGGKGANQAVAAARAGGRVNLMACVGRDSFGQLASKFIHGSGVGISNLVQVRNHPTGTALIQVARNGENSIAVAPGANSRLSAAAVRRRSADFSRADVLLLQLEVPLESVCAAAQIAAAKGKLVVLNPAPAPRLRLPESLLRNVSVITPNEVEAQQITGVRAESLPGLKRAAAWFHQRGVKIVIITLGRRGSFVSSEVGDRLQELVRAFPVVAKDTVGAGDIFNGNLAVALGEGIGLVQAVRFASAAAAISVTRKGAADSAPYRCETVHKLGAI